MKRSLLALLLLVPLLATGDSTVDTVGGGGGGGASSVSQLGDDIACGSNEFVKRNAGDTGWECAAGAVGGDALTTSGLNQFAATTSANFRTVITNPTGSGAVVFADSPVLVSPALGTPSSGDPVNLSGAAPNVTAGEAVLASEDPANCVAGEVAGGVSQAWTAEDCLNPVTATEFSALAFGECFTLYAPTAEIQGTDDVQSVWRAPAAVTLTEVWCETDTGTVNMDLQIDDGSAADVMGADLPCDATSETDSTGLTGSMAAGNTLDFAITSVATSPTRLTVCIKYTR